MHAIIGHDLLPAIFAGGQLKFIANESVVAFFPAAIQHRDFSIPGANYDDESLGNALAGLVFPDRIEIRLHREFSQERVRTLWDALLQHPEAESLTRLPVKYGKNSI